MIGDINLHNAADYTHRNEQVDSANGAHGLRYQNNTLQYYSSNQWNNISGGGALYLYGINLTDTNGNVQAPMYILSKIDRNIMSTIGALGDFLNYFGSFDSGNFILLPKLCESIEIGTSNNQVRIDFYQNYKYYWHNTSPWASVSMYIDFDQYRADCKAEASGHYTYHREATKYQIVSKQTLN